MNLLSLPVKVRVEGQKNDSGVSTGPASMKLKEVTAVIRQQNSPFTPRELHHFGVGHRGVSVACIERGKTS